MERSRKCILCETVHSSKQEMDEHMRSMLHHRELEKLKGRDCGHECRVCKVTVASLTDYASHISSPTHKHNVEAAEKKQTGRDRDEDYFDQVLVDLIEKRKEKIRKEKEAEAAKLAKEEEDRKRKEEFQQRLKEAKERYRLDSTWQNPSEGFSGSSYQNSWYRKNRYNFREGEARPWHHSQQGKSATWHAQEPPNFQRWASGEFAGGSLNNQQGRGNRQWDHSTYSGNQQSRLPWLSNGGSSNGVYGRNNLFQKPQRGRPNGLVGPLMFPPPPSFLKKAFNQFQNTCKDKGGQQCDGLQNGEGQTAEPDHSSNKSSKNFGSNPKLDKTCRWAPYPVTKSSETVPHKETNPNPSEKSNPKVSKQQKQDKTAGTSALNRKSRPEHKPKQLTSCEQNVQEKGKPKIKPQTKSRDPSSSSSRSSSAQRDGHQSSASGSSNQMVNKPLPHKERNHNTANQAQAQTKATVNQSPQVASNDPLQSKKERKLPGRFNKARQSVLERKSSLDSSSNKMEMAQNIVEEPQRVLVQSQIGVNKENSHRQNEETSNVLDSARPKKSSNSSQFLQSLHVSTSTMEVSEPAALNRKEERKKEKEAAVLDEGMQTSDAGQSSESDTPRSIEVGQLLSESSTSSLSKLDLLPVLKRDLTKHISSKTKTGSHEPNLNIARRVRNLSESRRSDPEKDTGLKPTVRQLISSSGSRRNVNWEQVYQEVRKKQDKGKGMPRFGIEMVPLDQEDQSQEEDDIHLLEGFHWDTLTEISTSTSSRKRSLSESSLAPVSTHALFTSERPDEAATLVNPNSLNTEKRRSSVSPTPVFAGGNKDNQNQQEVEQTFGQFEAEEQEQPEKLTSATAKAIKRSDSILGDSSSETELFDSQGTAKRRRAARDVQSAETSFLEHSNKRRKVKSKKERQQIDQLLTVSLREEELSRSLQTVDSSLIQARATLQAAYMEVQRLMVVKEQMTSEMGSLRNERIELLKGMKGSLEAAPQVQPKEEKMEPLEAEPRVPSCVTLSSIPDTGAAPSPAPTAERASPPSPSLSLMPVVIKQEPQSPVHVCSELDAWDNRTHTAHSTTPDAASQPDAVFNFQPPPERETQPHQAECTGENFDDPADCKESSSNAEAIQARRNCPLPDIKPSTKLLSPSRRDSEVGGLVDTHCFEPPSIPSGLNTPASPSELRSGKRVRKLKKRKVLKKAQGTEQPESSDTELDGEAFRPRWLRTRRRPSGGVQVTTSTQPAEDRDVDMNIEMGVKTSRQRRPPGPKPPKYLADLPQVAPAELVLKVESEESMEVVVASQQPHTDAMAPASPPPQVPDITKQDPQSLACNEVTSTSDMDICKSSESDIQGSVLLPKIKKNSSDVSSDRGDDDLPTEGVFEGHQEAVNAMQIQNGILYTCSGDRTVKAFDLVTHKCVGVFEGHSSKVSCLLVSVAPSLPHRLYSGSSDQTIRCYRLKNGKMEQQFSLSDRVLCLHSRWGLLYAGLANGTVVTFNLKTNKQMNVFDCHGPRAVSCLASSQEGARRILLVGSYDSTISVRDAKNGLLLRTLEGHTKTVLCMEVVNDLVFSGSSDQCVYAHNIHTGELVRVYKGHSHAVTVVDVLGKVMVTACLDKLVRVYDLQSHEQLQVYSGHKDMVMCMTVHKNMIYTGCYDGSVQAVKLDLLQNHRCRWHGCTMVFGMMEHLQQHLINDHTAAKLQTLKCRWKNCEEVFCARSSTKQVMLVHLQKHAEEEMDQEP